MPVRRFLRVLPWPARRRAFAVVRRVVARLPARHRLRTARRLTPLAPRPPRITPDAPVVRVRTGAGRVTARRDATAGPVGARRDTLDAVVAALDAAGVDWFRIPHPALTRTAVAVAEPDRSRAAAALSRLGATTAGRDVLRVTRPVTDPGSGWVLAGEYACEVEFWRRHDGHLVGPRPNPVCDVVAADAPAVTAAEPVFSEFADPGDPARYRTREVFTRLSPDRVGFAVDAVYTWVDGSDPEWRARQAEALRANPWVTGAGAHTANASRFACREELRYSLRALHCFAPWIRRVFLVTDGQLPAWLDTGHPKLTTVRHAEIFGSSGRLPTFNSHAIESRLHHIPGLAEHFLYLNDDVFLGRPVPPRLFFTPGGLTRFFPSPARVDSAPPSPADLPVNAAGKTNRRLIERAYGRILTHKMMHTPHACRRSVLAEIAERFPAELAATAGHQFRHPDDVALLSSLQQYYGYLSGRAVPGDIRYAYADLADPGTPMKLARIRQLRHLDAFCLNDTWADAATAAEQAGLLAEFLPSYLPFPSPYERVPPIAGGGAS
jgi:hypothetical protein